MNRLGMLVRCDQGGLGNLTYTMWQHLKPERTLVIDPPDGQCRGARNPHKYQAPWTTTTAWSGTDLPASVLRNIAEDVDVLFTVETMYTGAVGWRMVSKLCRSVVLVMPELAGDLADADQIVIPTTWRHEEMTKSFGSDRVSVISPPSPDAGARARLRTGSAAVFYHLEAPAMLDRNGTHVVLDACREVQADCTVIIRTHRKDANRPSRLGRVKLEWVDDMKDDPLDCYPEEVDVQLMPRRYGGLCMPVSEAAALGIPSVMPNLSPQRDDRWPCWFTDPGDPVSHRMKGGTVPVYHPTAEDVASVMEQLVLGSEGVMSLQNMSEYAFDWSNTWSWESIGPQWEAVLRAG